MLPTLAVIFDFGSAVPMDISVAADGICDLVFVCDPESEHVQRCLPLLEESGKVLYHRETEETARQLRDIGARGVITFSDKRIRLAAHLAERLGLPFHSAETAVALTDKVLQRTRLAAHAVPVPAFSALTGIDQASAALARTGLPAVVKPTQGAGSRNTFRVHTEEQYTRAVEGAFAAGENSMVVESMLVGDPAVAGAAWGDYVSVESVAVAGRFTHLGITGHFRLADPFRETGAFHPSTLRPDTAQQVLAAAQAALDALGITDGLCHTELKLTPEGARVIEVNGRLGGVMHNLYQVSSGISLIEIGIRAALGDRTLPEPARPERVAYHYWLVAPQWATSVSKIHGTARTGALPNVSRIEPMVAEGSPIDWRTGVYSVVASVQGAVPDHDGLAAVVAAVDENLTVEYAGLPGTPAGHGGGER